MAKKSRWASEASQSALLRFAPQLRALEQLRREAEGTYKTGVAQASGNADASIATIQGAQRQVGGYYDRAGLDQARTASVVNKDLAGLPGLSDDLRAAVGLEQADAGSRVSTGRAQAQSGLSQQLGAARSGAQYAGNKAYDDLVQALTKIGEQRQGILSDQGTFTSTEEARLSGEARDRALRVSLENLGNSQSERNSIRSSGIDPDTGKPIPGGKLDPKKQHGKTSATGVNLNPAGAHQTARTAIRQGIAALGRLDPDRTDRHEAAPLLITGQKAETLHDTKTGKPKLSPTGVELSTPDIPGVGEWATVAADVYYDGHLSRANQKLLADNGYSIKQLGLPTYAQWKRQGGRTKPGLPSGSTLFPPLQRP
jgi:hypothetical protein